MTLETCESFRSIGTLPHSGVEDFDVKRDLDYIRQILTDMEASDERLFHLLTAQGRPLPSDPKREYHVRLLAKEGLLVQEAPGIFWMSPRGHDFLDHTRDETVWEQSKEAAAKMKDFSIGMLMRVAEGYVIAKLREITGLDL